MDFKWYPEPLTEDETPSVKEFIQKVLNTKKKRRYFLLVNEFLKKLSECDSIDPYVKCQMILPLKKGLYEMRIPKTRKEGVVRIYFQFHPYLKTTLVLLDAEFKKEKEPSRLDCALGRMKQYNEYAKRECNVKK